MSDSSRSSLNSATGRTVYTSLAKPFELVIEATDDETVGDLIERAEDRFGLTGRYALYLTCDGYRLTIGDRLGKRDVFRLVAQL